MDSTPYRAGRGAANSQHKSRGHFCISLPHCGSQMTFFIRPMGHKHSYPGLSLETLMRGQQAGLQGSHEPRLQPKLPGFKFLLCSHPAP